MVTACVGFDFVKKVLGRVGQSCGQRVVRREVDADARLWRDLGRTYPSHGCCVKGSMPPSRYAESKSPFECNSAEVRRREIGACAGRQQVIYRTDTEQTRSGHRAVHGNTRTQTSFLHDPFAMLPSKAQGKDVSSPSRRDGAPYPRLHRQASVEQRVGERMERSGQGVEGRRRALLSLTWPVSQHLELETKRGTVCSSVPVMPSFATQVHTGTSTTVRRGEKLLQGWRRGGGAPTGCPRRGSYRLLVVVDP